MSIGFLDQVGDLVVIGFLDQVGDQVVNKISDQVGHQVVIGFLDQVGDQIVNKISRPGWRPGCHCQMELKTGFIENWISEFSYHIIVQMEFIL